MNRHGTAQRLVRGATSGAGLFLLLIGVPVVLAALAGWPLPHRLPDPERIKAVLGSRAELPSAVVIKTVAVVGWIAWLEITLAVLVETGAQLRHRTVHRLRLPGGTGAQALAAHLVAGVLLLAGTRGALAPIQPLPAVVAVASTSPVPGGSPIAAGEAVTQGDYTVRPGDWLSTIARDELGDLRRYPEIARLNYGRPQPDGAALRNANLIHPGWKLRLPEARSSTEVRPPTPAPVGGSIVTPLTPHPCAAPVPAAATPGGPTEPVPDPGDRQAHDAPPDTAPVRSHDGSDRPSPAGWGGSNEDGGDASPVRVLSMVLPGAVAGLAVLRVVKLRANQQRRRRTGRTVARPPAGLAEQETRIRSIADTDAPQWVDAATRRLWSALAGTSDVPGVIAVRAGTLGVELLLDRPSPLPPAGFVAADDGHTWRLDHRGDLDALVAMADGQSSALPALLYVGDTPEGALWLNLEHAGTLSVEGHPEAVQTFLAAAVTHLAAAPWGDALDVMLPRGDGRLEALEHIRVVSPEEAVHEAGWAPRCGATSSRLAARVAPPGLEALAPTIVLAEPASLDPDQTAVLAAAALPESGFVLIASGPVPDATWRLEFTGDGTALLHPLALQLAFGAHMETSGAVIDLIAHAADDDDVPVSHAGSDTSDAAMSRTAQAEVRIRILGPVEIDWAARSAPRPKAGEIVAYLATRDHPVQGDRLRVDLWPAPPNGDEIADATARTNISRARKALGVDHDGRPHMPEAEHGAFRLGPGITTDWHRFRYLAGLARNAPSDEAIEHYREAMSLIRGAPFAEHPKGTYHWIHGDGLYFAIETAVAEAAEHFAELLLDEGEHRLADWACRQALKVTPYREPLYQFRMRAAHQAGDHDAIERIYRELRLALRRLGDLEEPHPETVALYESLRRDSDPPMAATG
jgi:DNA-binding SARP family transcriptional activator